MQDLDGFMHVNSVGKHKGECELVSAGIVY